MVAKIYQVASDPYIDEDDETWNMKILWTDDEDGTMGSGSIILPFKETGYLFQKYFRHNVTPLSPEKVQQIIEESVKGVRQ